MSVEIPMRGSRAIFVGIYSLTSPSGKVYIGQSWDVLKRWTQYRTPSGIRSQPKLQHSLQKHGGANHQFKILSWYSAGCDQPTLNSREQSWIDHYRGLGVELLNTKEGGSRGKPSLDTIRKGVETRRANGSYIASLELRAKRSVVALGRRRSKDSIAKGASAQKGQSRPHMTAWNKNRVRTAEEKQKQSDARKLWWATNRDRPRRKACGYKRSEESRRKYSENKRAWWAAKKAQESA